MLSFTIACRRFVTQKKRGSYFLPGVPGFPRPLTLTNHSTPSNWRIMKLILELVAQKGRLWKNWNTKKPLRIAILCQCVAFAT